MQRFLVPLLLAGCAWSANAQQTPTSRIESLGQSTVYAPPTHVEFWLTFQARDASMELAMKAVQEFEGRLHAKVTEVELRPSNFEIAAPSVPDVRETRVVISAFVKFPMSPYFNVETGAEEFAKLCDKMTKIAQDLECDLAGPSFDTTERDSMVQAAASAATESAYPAAEAIARTLNSSVYAVESVQVLEVLWNEPLEYQGVEPTIRQLSCTARVRVTYVLRGAAQAQ